MEEEQQKSKKAKEDMKEQMERAVLFEAQATIKDERIAELEK